MAMKKRKDRAKNGHSGGTDRYLITYADLITLLLGLFVILYATSQVDASKYQEASQAFSQYFAGDGEGNLPGDVGVLPESNAPVDGTEKTIEQISSEFSDSLSSQINDSLITVERVDDGVLLTLSESLLFASGRAEIQVNALQALESLRNVMTGVNKQIEISGHTDSDSINTFRYASNWHLSVARATNVAYFLSQAIPDAYMTISGRADKEPKVPNNSAEAKSRNRRVEILIKELPNDTPSTRLYDPPSARQER